MKHLLLLLCLSMTLSKTVMATQEGQIAGTVANEQQEPVQGASVVLRNVGSQDIVKTTLTDEKGKYIFLSVPHGSYLVEVSAVGMVGVRSEIGNFVGKNITVPTIILLARATELEAVDIKRDVPLVESRQGKLILNVENSSLAAGNNAFDILKRAPGVQVDKDDNIALMGREGVNVTIDGRSVYMTGSQLATLLKSMDGAQVKSIEVSTQRTAKDDAEGTAGLINITTKKNRMVGFNGAFAASAGMGSLFRGNSSLNLNYRKNNTTLFGNYAYSNDGRQSDLGLERLISNDDEHTMFDQSAVLKQIDRNHDFKVGIEQRTSERNTFMIQLTGGNNHQDEDNESLTNMGTGGRLIDSLMETSTLQVKRFDRYSVNANNEFKLDTTGKKLTIDADYSVFKTQTDVDYEYHTFFPDRSYMYDPEFERSRAVVDIHILMAKADYTQSLGKGTLETGVKYSRVRSDNDIFFEQQLSGSWANNPLRTNIFNYTEQIAAAYMEYGMAWGKWGINGGLRGEYTVSDGISLTKNKRIKRDYPDLFPSASVSYNAGENHVFNLSYARKISRPNYRYLNPFEYYIDKRTFIKGNEELRPQYTNNLTLSYTLFKMFNVSVGHDHTADAMVESIGQDPIEKTTWVIRENLGRTNTTYVNLSIPMRIGKVWTMYNNLTGIHMYFKGPIAGFYVSQGSTFFQGSSMNSFKLNKAISAELNMNYNSPFIYNVYRIHHRFNTDMGVTYNFKNERSSLKMAVTDVFRSNMNNLSTDFEIYHSKIRQYHDSQSVRLTFNYKFGNLKQSVRKREDNSEEKKRAM